MPEHRLSDPVEEIRLFLGDVADGVYDGKPQMLDVVQTVENEALRQKLACQRYKRRHDNRTLSLGSDIR